MILLIQAQLHGDGQAFLNKNFRMEDIFNNELSLPDERLKHINEKHPEITINSIKSLSIKFR